MHITGYFWKSTGFSWRANWTPQPSAICYNRQWLGNRDRAMFDLYVGLLIGSLLVVPLAAILAAWKHLRVFAGFLAVFGVFLSLSLLLFAHAQQEKDQRTSNTNTQESQLSCKQDLQCWGDKNIFSAISVCKPSIEKLAGIDYRLTDGLLDLKFTRFKWENTEKSTVIYFGDAIQFQNEIGNWIRHTYSCVYDPRTNTAAEANAWPGHL